MQDFLITDLQLSQQIDAFLLLRSIDQRKDKNGNPYLDLMLADSSGDINGKMWAGLPDPLPNPGTVVNIRGTVQEYNGRRQLRVEKLRDVQPTDDVDASMLTRSAPEKPEAMLQKIRDTVAAFQSEDLRKLVTEMLRIAGKDLMHYPAAQSMHHAERSGLLHHTTSMLQTAEYMIQAYPQLNGDLLRAGVILHDLGKINELKSDEMGNVSDYTQDGLLIGHLVRGVATLQQAADRVGVQGEIVTLLQHMILSHHGIAEYGSPRMPMFPEAEMLHWIDVVDARMNEMAAAVDRTPSGAFSETIRSLDRRIYHPMYESLAGDKP